MQSFILEHLACEDEAQFNAIEFTPETKTSVRVAYRHHHSEYDTEKSVPIQEARALYRKCMRSGDFQRIR